MEIINGVLSDVKNSDIIDGVFIVPEGVTSIGYGAFRGCSNLTEIKIPEGVTRIGDGAFYNCNSLTKIEIPEGVTSIGVDAFGYCSSLTKIEILEGVTIIYGCAFYNCNSLTKIEIPEGVTSIGDSAFYNCRSLTGIKIPEGVTNIGREAFKNCSSLAEIKIPEGVTSIEYDAFRGCSSLTEIEIPENVLDNNIENLMYLPSKVIFKDNYEAIERIKEKAHFDCSEDYNEEFMNILYYKMARLIGTDEIERIVELPNLTEDEIKEYTLEKDEAFQSLYDTKYQIMGDFGVTLELLKKLDLSKTKKTQEGKNTEEMKLFKTLNQKLEENYSGNLTDLISSCFKEQNIEIANDLLKQIQSFEKSINKSHINEILEKSGEKITESLNGIIVERQIVPVQAMVEDAIRDYYKENGRIDFDAFKIVLNEKIGTAHAPYIIQNKDNIVNQVLDVLKNDEFFIEQTQNHSPLDSLKRTKENIGSAWKYKLNQKLKEIGYSFSNLPNEFSKEEIEKISELVGEKAIQTKATAVLKEGADREEAYKLLAKKDLPKIVTYKQIHDMFGSVHGPYSEEFKEYFKKHRKEFWEDPQYFEDFGRISNNFKEIINSPELKNTYESGKLEIDQILGYLKSKRFENQRPDDEELARLATGVGDISTEEEFAGVQKIFDITRKRERSSIPPVKVVSQKFRGRMLLPDDVLNLFAGDITTCCQKFNDVGEGAMLLGSIEENGGIFVVEELDENGNPENIIGQSLTIRQKGETGEYDRLTFDNIEITDSVKKRLSKEDQTEILEIYKQAGRQAIEKDKKFLKKLVEKGKITQEQYDSLVLKEVIAGTGYNDLDGLKEQPMAKIVVPDEARNTYFSISGQSGHPWIDSAGGDAPTGSDGIPVILATMDEDELVTIKKRQIDSQWKVNIKPKEVPLWYRKVDEVQNLSDSQINKDKIEKIKKIEKIAYREEQQTLNEYEVETAEDIEDVYEINNMKVKLGSNDDWYLIYEENEDEIFIADLAVVGGINSQKNEELPKSNSKLAIAESSTEMYKLMLDAVKNGKQLYCNATGDTSLVNIKKMLQKGIIDVRDMDGNNLEYFDGNLVYEGTNDAMEGRNWRNDEEIQMYDLEIIPHEKEIEAVLEQSEKWLAKVQETIQMSGKEKEEGLDEMRNQIREEWKDTNDEK